MKKNLNEVITSIDDLVLNDDELILIKGGNQDQISCGAGCGLGCGQVCGSNCTGCPSKPSETLQQA